MKLHEEARARAHTHKHPHQLLHVRSFQITHQFEWVPRFWCDDFFDINFVVIHGVASFNSNGRWCWQPQTREICLKFCDVIGFQVHCVWFRWTAKVCVCRANARKYVEVDLNATIKRYDELWEVQDVGLLWNAPRRQQVEYCNDAACHFVWMIDVVIVLPPLIIGGCTSLIVPAAFCRGCSDSVTVFGSQFVGLQRRLFQDLFATWNAFESIWFCFQVSRSSFGMAGRTQKRTPTKANMWPERCWNWRQLGGFVIQGN